MRRFGIITLVGICLIGCSTESSPSDQALPAIPVLVSSVKLQDVPVQIESLGVVHASSEVEIKPQVNGLLSEAHFQEGQFVKKGTLLFTIEPDLYVNKTKEAQGQLVQDKAALATLQKKLERINSLTKRDLIPQQEVDELQGQLAGREAAVQMDEARLASAKIDQRNCRITAPIDGHTGKIQMHPGNWVSSSQTTPLVTLANTDILTVEFHLTEPEIQRLGSAHPDGNFPIEIAPLGDKGKKVTGKLTFLDRRIDTKTGLFLLRGRFENNEKNFFPGQGVKVTLNVSQISQAKTIPQKAVKINQQGFYVYTINEDKSVAIRQVTVGSEVGDDIVILEGLADGETVVTDGHLRLSPGLKVEIKP